MEKFEFLIEKINLLFGEVDNLIKQVNEISSQQSETPEVDLTEVNSRLSTLEQNVSSLSSTASSLSTTLSSHSSAINQNAQDISTNAQNISTNTSNISTNTSNISANTSAIATNASDIAANTTAIETNASGIATNASNISSNTSAIATNAQNIATNALNISSQASSISSLTSRMLACETDISGFGQAIQTNASDIADLQTAISAMQLKLNTLHSFNYIINPDFYINTSGYNTFETYGTEIAFVDQWKMGISNASQAVGTVNYTYGTNVFYLCKNGYIKQEISDDDFRTIKQKYGEAANHKITLSVCVSGAVAEGVYLNLVYKTTSFPNGLSKKVSLAGNTDYAVYSINYSVAASCTGIFARIINTASTATSVQINWVKLEVAPEFTDYQVPLNAYEKQRCTFTGV